MLPWKLVLQTQATIRDYTRNYQAYASKSPVNQLFDNVYTALA